VLDAKGGLSYEYVVQSLGPELGARTVIAHLGSGVSLVALRDGVPIDTTMSFTATGGVMMGTCSASRPRARRCGRCSSAVRTTLPHAAGGSHEREPDGRAAHAGRRPRRRERGRYRPL